ncbi:MAG TPA: LysM domain-containing protein, partial [Aliidongia sp.]|uniref:LysM peptidoglycan-binding domain-containing protein n=1 Tax=Aliidongia sp. TaxID=1914230 RepID=UPI002DDCFE98
AGTAGADWSGPIAAGVVLATTVGLYGYKLYTRVQQSNTYEGTNQTFLQYADVPPGLAKQLANDDQYGNSVGPVFQATAAKLGISQTQMGQFLASFKDPQQLKNLVLAAQNVQPDKNGNFPVALNKNGDTVPDAPANLSPSQLKTFYQNNSSLLGPESRGNSKTDQEFPEITVIPPANAGDQYYRSLAAKAETPKSIDGLIQWAKDNGVAFPTAPPPAAPKVTPPVTATPPTTTTPVPPAPTTRVVTAKAGDTLEGIAKANGTTLPTLEKLNPQFDWSLFNGNPFTPPNPPGKRDPDLLRIGDKINIPIPTDSTPNQRVALGGRRAD